MSAAASAPGSTGVTHPAAEPALVTSGTAAKIALILDFLSRFAAYTYIDQSVSSLGLDGDRHLSIRYGQILAEHVVNRLPIRCTPIPGESLNGFVVRLSEANAIDRASWLADVLKLPFPENWYRAEEIERLAVASGQTLESLNELSPTPIRRKGRRQVSTILGADVPTDFFVRSLRRVCPRCISESAHHRIIWDMRFVRSCTEHGIRLLAVCPECGKRLNWNIKSVCHCSCGFDLRTTPGESVEAQALSGTRFFQSMLQGREQAVPTLLAGLDLDEALLLVWDFAWFCGGGINAGNDDDVGEGMEIWLAQGLKLLSHEPAAFEEELLSAATNATSARAHRTLALLTRFRDVVGQMAPKAAALAEIVEKVLARIRSRDASL